LAGVNLAIVYGVGLIVAALVLRSCIRCLQVGRIRLRKGGMRPSLDPQLQLSRSDMLYTTSPAAIGIFLFFVAIVLGLSFYLGRRARSSRGYYAAHGQIHWAVNGRRICRRLFVGRVVSRHLRDDCVLRLRRFLIFHRFLAGWIVALFRDCRTDSSGWANSLSPMLSIRRSTRPASS